MKPSDADRRPLRPIKVTSVNVRTQFLPDGRIDQQAWKQGKLVLLVGEGVMPVSIADVSFGRDSECTVTGYVEL